MRSMFLLAALFALPAFDAVPLDVASSEPIHVDQAEPVFEQLELAPADLDVPVLQAPAALPQERVDPSTVAELHPSETLPGWTWPAADQRLDRVFAGVHGRSPAV